jgi:hypothetical protein
MKNSTASINLSTLWANAQDLNFGEITEVVHAAASAAEDKIFEIRKAKFKAAGKQPKELTEPLRTLLRMGCKQAGTYNPDEALACVEEQMTDEDFETAQAFLKWLVKNKRTFGHNLPDVWNDYQKDLLTA